MVIEYIGEVIRSELSETREKQYQEKVYLSSIPFHPRRLLNCVLRYRHQGSEIKYSLFYFPESRYLHVQIGRGQSC